MLKNLFLTELDMKSFNLIDIVLAQFQLLQHFHSFSLLHIFGIKIFLHALADSHSSIVHHFWPMECKRQTNKILEFVLNRKSRATNSKNLAIFQTKFTQLISVNVFR